MSKVINELLKLKNKDKSKILTRFFKTIIINDII